MTEHAIAPTGQHIVKLIVKDSQYDQWDIVAMDDNSKAARAFPLSLKDNYPDVPSPTHYKGFHYDVIDVSEPTHPVLIFSPTRNAAYISGVLILEGNRSYGRTTNRKRLLYRCIPDDKHLPHFLVPYDMIIDFNKAHRNKYVLFRFQEWSGEHPSGLLVETLGDVNQFEAFYEYQLYSKSLHSSVKEMTQRIKEMTQKKTMEEYFNQTLQNPEYNIHDWTLWQHPPQVFTIDPPNTTDYDDGFSLDECPDTGRIRVTVYVANVVFWLEAFQLWNSFDNRIATIYLPDRRRPMLPSVLSESLCSLKESTRRFALAIQFYLDKETYELDITATKIQNVVICPYKNYVYEDPKMVYQDINYMRLLDATVRLDSRIKNSRDVVTFWMVKTNTYMAQYMIQHKTGIFRVGKYLRRESTAQVPSDAESDQENSEEEIKNYDALDQTTRRFIEYHAKAQSVCYDDTLDLEHEVLDKKAYLRITSVIRRYEDVCNECELMRIMGIKLRNGGSIRDHYNEKLCNERYMNIRKVESNSVMFKRTSMGENIVKGILYSRYKCEDGRFEYKVYVKGEGINKVKTREKKELYKEYTLKRYIKEKGGGMKIKMEIYEELPGTSE